MRIHSVEKLDKRHWRLTMESGDCLLCEDRLAKRLDLKEGVLLSETVLAAMTESTEVYAEQCALRHLGFKRRTEHETRRHLEDRGVPESFAEKVVQKMKRLGFLDDRAYGEDYADELIGKNRSTWEIRMKMTRKGLSASLTEEILEDRNADGGEGNRAAEQLEKNFPEFETPDDRGRMRRHLYRKGFSMESIHKAFRIIEERRRQ